MSIIASVQGAVGEHRYSQHEVTEVFSRIVSPKGDHAEAIKRIHTATQVNFRNLVLPASAYEEMRSFGERNDAFIDIALRLSEDVISKALESAGIRSDEVDLIVAFSLKCPHQGVTVSRDEKGWVCSAHLSEFEADGGLLLGPATKRLTRVPIKVTRGIAAVG